MFLQVLILVKLGEHTMHKILLIYLLNMHYNEYQQPLWRILLHVQILVFLRRGLKMINNANKCNMKTARFFFGTLLCIHDILLQVLCGFLHIISDVKRMLPSFTTMARWSIGHDTWLSP